MGAVSFDEGGGGTVEVEDDELADDVAEDDEGAWDGVGLGDVWAVGCGLGGDEGAELARPLPFCSNGGFTHSFVTHSLGESKNELEGGKYPALSLDLYSSNITPRLFSCPTCLRQKSNP